MDKIIENEQPTLEIDEDGYKRWRLNGQRHRIDGPAVIRPDGSKGWFIGDKLHREDGPATEYSDGDIEWFLNGIKYSFKQFIATTPIPEVEKTRLMLLYA